MTSSSSARRWWWGRVWIPLTVSMVLALAACTGFTNANPSSTAAGPPAAGPEQGRIAAVARDAMAKYRLKALIVRVISGGKDIYTGALGESMTGVPATADMHVRNGFVAYSYLTTMLLQFVDQKKISLDDKLAKYLPELPEANVVTIKMIADSTSGYADYVYQPAVSNGIYRDPFRQWTTAGLIKIGTSAPPTFPPGANLAYSHTNYAILGTVLAKVGGRPLGELMQQYIFTPMGLKQTQWSDTPRIPEPVLHTFSSERRATLGIQPDTPFFEDSTFWNPSWTAPEGASQTTDIADLTTSIAAMGSGKLLSPQSHHTQTNPNPVGFGHPASGCAVCTQNTTARPYGMAVILLGPWIIGNKFYAESGAVVGYLLSAGLAIAVVTTYQPSAFDSQGNVTDAGPAIMSSVARAVAPDTPVPG